MLIHVVRPGESAYSIALAYGIPMSQLVLDNGLESSGRLAVGQALVIQFPLQTHTVQPGETASSIAASYGLSLRQLYRSNPILGGQPDIYPGETLVIAYDSQPEEGLTTNGYAYPFIPASLLHAVLPYLTYLTPFTYGFTSTGALVELDDGALLSAAAELGTAPLMHLSTLTESGGFSNELAHLALTDQALQDTLIDNLEAMLLRKGYRGLDVDFEYLPPEDAGAYAAFLARLTERLAPLGLPVLAALAPKTSADQPGTLYEGHDYAAIGAAVNRVLLMTYEWGYTYGPPMAVAPLPNVRRVVEYALTEIPAEKLWLGVPLYGYDWPLPFVQGRTKARSLSPQEAVALAVRYGVEIQYSAQSQAPWFRYTDEHGGEHEVWFEDARSIQAKLDLIPEYGMDGVGYWNLNRPFPQNWRVLNALFSVRPE